MTKYLQNVSIVIVILLVLVCNHLTQSTIVTKYSHVALPAMETLLNVQTIQSHKQ